MKKTHTIQAKPNGGISLNFTPSVLYALEGNGSRDSHKGNGWKETDTMFTLNTIERHAVVYGIDPLSSNSMKSANPHSGFHEMDVAKCIDTSDGNPGKNQGGMCVVYDTTQITSPMNYSNPKPGDPCHPLAAQQHPPLAVYDCHGNGNGKTVPTLTGDHQNRVTDYTALCVGNGQLNQISMQDKSNTLDCMHDQQAILTSGNHQRKYIVRRLTPLECCRLQGFPDWWEDGVEGSDSARYKMWGNGIALPCAVDVLRRVAKAARNEA